MIRCLAGGVLVAVFLGIPSLVQTRAAPLPASGQPLQIHVNLVNVPVNVTDAHGRPVTGLKRGDFALSEDGKPQRIRLFQANAAQPVSVVLAIDTSVSVRSDLPVARQAAVGFAQSFLRPEDRVELLNFSGNVTKLVPFTANLHRFDQGLGRMRADGPTALYAAIARGAADLRPFPGRKVIVVISDGSNSIAGIDYQEARTAALRAQASIESIILVPIDANAGRDLGGEHALIQLSRDTGGIYLYADASNSLRDAMTRLSLALRSEYLLGYYPTSTQTPGVETGGFRRIQVRLTRPVLDRACHLDYRTGYYAEAAP